MGQRFQRAEKTPNLEVATRCYHRLYQYQSNLDGILGCDLQSDKDTEELEKISRQEILWLLPESY